MGTWARTGPVVVEVDGSAEGLRVVDYACLEAIRSGAELMLAAPYQAHGSISPMTPGCLPKPPADREGDLIVVHAEPAPHRRADVTVAETLAGWSDEYPEVRVTRFLTARPVVAALMQESQQLGLIVLGVHAGPLPIGDPVARR